MISAKTLLDLWHINTKLDLIKLKQKNARRFAQLYVKEVEGGVYLPIQSN
jgi:hypothetical protein